MLMQSLDTQTGSSAAATSPEVVSSNGSDDTDRNSVTNVTPSIAFILPLSVFQNCFGTKVLRLRRKEMMFDLNSAQHCLD